jgi:MFS family permease
MCPASLRPDPDSGDGLRRLPLNARQVGGYLCASLGFGMFFALNNASLPLYLRYFTANAVLISLMGSTDSIEGVLIQPLVGSASDRSRNPLGRRRPYLLLFAPLSALFIALTPCCARLTEPFRLAAMVAAIVVFTALFCAASTPYRALLADIAPPSKRGRLTGLSGLVMVLGQAALMLAPVSLEARFGITAAILLLSSLLTVALVREPEERPADSARPKRTNRTGVRQSLAGLRVLKQARILVLVGLLTGVGLGAVVPLLTISIVRLTGCSDQEAQRVFLWLMLSTAVALVPAGRLTDRVGAKPVLAGGLCLIALAALGGLRVTTLPEMTAMMLVAGVGNAAQTASAYPLLTRLVPAEEVGFYTGLQSAALSATIPLTAVAAGWLVNQGHVRAIFGFCFVLVALGISVLLRLNPGRSDEEVAVRQRELSGAGG